jgi:hypothetical protein
MRGGRSGRTMLVLAGTLALAACGQGTGAPNGDILSNSLTPPATPPAEEPATPAKPLPTDAWIGRWTGPEGLFLDVKTDQPGSGRYALTIKADLDSAGDKYDGRAEGETIRFTRGASEQTIQVGTGPETGFKWLADKADCLIVVTGKEGYCRD